MNTKPIIENRIWQPESECMPRETLRALQVERLQAAVARAANVPFYKEQFASLGVTGPEGVFGRPAGAAARGLNPFIAPLQPGGERLPDSAEPIPANMVPQVTPSPPAAVPAAGGGR